MSIIFTASSRSAVALPFGSKIFAAAACEARRSLQMGDTIKQADADCAELAAILLCPEQWPYDLRGDHSGANDGNGGGRPVAVQCRGSEKR